LTAAIVIFLCWSAGTTLDRYEESEDE
jgi:hypothetical protein